MKRILIAGCGGMLGQAFYEVFGRDFEVKATDIDLNEKWLSKLDVRDYDDYRTVAKKFKPDFIFHLAALTDLEYCELHASEAYLTNTVGTENAVLLAREFNIPLVYISTAGIFDGKKENYDDYDLPNPISHYGRSKYQGELFVQQNLSRYFIFRAGWMMGGGPRKDKKFVAKIIRQLKAGKKEIFALDDLFGSPTYTLNLAENARRMLTTGYYGLYNMVSRGGATRYDVAKEILKALGFAKKIKLTKVTSAHFAKEYFAPRPRSEQLVNLKLNLRGLNGMKDWKAALGEYLAKHWAHGI